MLVPRPCQSQARRVLVTLPGEARRTSSNQRTNAVGNPSTLKRMPEEVVTKG